LNLNPNSPETYNSFGNLLGRENKPDEAVRQFEQALRLRPDFAVAHYNLALALKSMGRHAEAAHEFEQAKRLDPRLGP
jgi:tetratricopeptide (TPR) repeat protein